MTSWQERALSRQSQRPPISVNRTTSLRFWNFQMTISPHFSICVYCGSRPGENPSYAQAAHAVGTWIGQHGGQLVYGGGRTGLMGMVADATKAAGGRVVGVIPQALVDKELANQA